VSEPIRVAVVDYGAGNLISIRNALGLLGAEVSVADAPDGLEGAEVILVPGVGASEAAMGRLRRQGLVEPIIELVHAGTWFVGVCLGMQLLFESSDEDGAQMLGLLEGEVKMIQDAPSLPHIGWNRLHITRSHPVLEGLPEGAPAYFVHSYVPVPADPDITIAETEHGSRFTSLVARDRIVGFQFHPERSGADGIAMLRNTLGLIEADRPAVARASA
jgi:glutamine amidotransferase